MCANMYVYALAGCVRVLSACHMLLMQARRCQVVSGHIASSKTMSLDSCLEHDPLMSPFHAFHSFYCRRG